MPAAGSHSSAKRPRGRKKRPVSRRQSKRIAKHVESKETTGTVASPSSVSTTVKGSLKKPYRLLFTKDGIEYVVLRWKLPRLCRTSCAMHFMAGCDHVHRARGTRSHNRLLSSRESCRAIHRYEDGACALVLTKSGSHSVAELNGIRFSGAHLATVCLQCCMAA